jgi:hypothetical protein
MFENVVPYLNFASCIVGVSYPAVILQVSCSSTFYFEYLNEFETI